MSIMIEAQKARENKVNKLPAGSDALQRPEQNHMKL